MSSNSNRVVVTGYGAICSLGNNSNEIWNSIKDYKVGYKKYSHPNPEVKALFFGRIDEKLDTSRIPKSINKYLPRFAQLGMIAADEAIVNAFGDNAQEEMNRYHSPFERGVIFGTGWGGQDSTIENNNLYLKHGIASPLSNILDMPSVCTGAISKKWKLRGYQNTPAAACATGNIAVGDAYEIIKSGKASLMIAGGGESIKDDYNIWAVDILGALCKEPDTPERACSPFAKGRNGFVMSEGAAVVCLEDLESAKKRGANILAEITGYANYSDGYDITAPAEDCLGRYYSITKALEQSNADHSQVDYINAHGTSTPLNDKNETETLKQVFGVHASSIPVSSTKSYTGHLIAGAGSMETIFSIKAIQENFIPATINLHTSDPECDLDYVPNEHRHGVNVKTVLNVNYGFGGANSSLVIMEV